MHKNRIWIQAFFVVLTLTGVFLVRGNAERWCPFGGVEALYTYLHEGNMVCSLGVSNLYVLGAVLLMTLLLRRAFCGYVCPVGALSDWLGAFTGKLGLKPWRVPVALDRVLSLLKYLVLAVILYLTWKSGELIFRGVDPCYALISRHGEDITLGTYLALGTVLVVSLFITIPFCRWLCPLAAVLNPLSRISPAGVTRHEPACIQCGKCARACPTAIPVDKVQTVRQARCLSCQNCVGVCPAKDNGALTWGMFNTKGFSRPQGLIAVVIGAILTLAVAGVWLAPMPSFVHERGVRPSQTVTADLNIQGLACRGKATLLVFFLDRNDAFAIDGYLKLEAWPGPALAKVRLTWDPQQGDKQIILDAICEPFYDAVDNRWRNNPFVVEGYDPLQLE